MNYTKIFVLQYLNHLDHSVIFQFYILAIQIHLSTLYLDPVSAWEVWEKVPYYTVEDTIPYGHGEKSVMMITEYMKLTVEEKYLGNFHFSYLFNQLLCLR